MVWDTEGAVFSAFHYKDALGAGAENKALHLSKNIEQGTRNREWRSEERMLNVQWSMLNVRVRKASGMGDYTV